MADPTWVGVSRRKPDVYRFRTIDGDHAIRITCWHGAQTVLVWPDPAVIANWAWYAALNPCRWVTDCPHHAWHLAGEQRHRDWAGDYVDFGSMGRRPNWRAEAAKNRRARP